MSSDEMDVDEIYSRIGEFGAVQKRYALFMCLGQVVSAFQMVLMVFVGADMKFTCDAADRTTMQSPIGQQWKAREYCSMVQSGKCAKLRYFHEAGFETIAKEWNLICDDSYKINSAQSLFMFGVLLGSLVFGMISDAMGRRKTTILAGIIVVVSTVASGMAWNYQIFTAMRMIAGGGQAGFGIASFIWGNELIGNSRRSLYGILFPTFFGLGICGLSALSYWFPNWRHLCLIVALIYGALTISYIIIPESPRWLLARHRVPEARAVLERIAIGNGAVFSPTLLDDLKCPNNLASHEKNEIATEGIGAICRNRFLFLWTAIQIYSWFANSVVYYGLTMTSGGLGANSLRIGVALSGLVELPAYGVLLLFANKFGRCRLISLSMLLAGASCAFIMLLPSDVESSHLKTLLALLGKTGISASFAMIYIHSAEFYPTVIRNAGLGICATAARFGGVVAPVVTLLGTSFAGMEFFAFGILGISSGLLNLKLPETLDRPLPETIADLMRMQGDSVGRRIRPFSGESGGSDGRRKLIS